MTLMIAKQPPSINELQIKVLVSLKFKIGNSSSNSINNMVDQTNSIVRAIRRRSLMIIKDISPASFISIRETLALPRNKIKVAHSPLSERSRGNSFNRSNMASSLIPTNQMSLYMAVRNI